MGFVLQPPHDNEKGCATRMLTRLKPPAHRHTTAKRCYLHAPAKTCESACVVLPYLAVSALTPAADSVTRDLLSSHITYERACTSRRSKITILSACACTDT